MFEATPRPVVGLLVGAALLALAPAAARADADPATGSDAAALLDAAIAGAHRSEANRARDVFRNPRETLLFFGFRPDKTVVEVTPGAGWYTEILAPALRDRGRLFAAHANPDGPEAQQRARAAFLEKMRASPQLYDRVEVTSFGRGIEKNLAPEGSADLVVTFRNVHNWQMAGFADEAFRAFHRALKPGGVLGVVEHRLPEDRPDTEESRRSGYVKQSEVIRLAEAAGFRFDAASEINANPRDTADHPNGVWSLPPTLRGGDTDRERFLAIGESDRMTLRFVKPAD